MKKLLLLGAALALAVSAPASAAGIKFGGNGSSSAWNLGGFAVGSLGSAGAVGGTVNGTQSQGIGQASGVAGAGVISLQPLGSLSGAIGVGTASGGGQSSSLSGSGLAGASIGNGIAGGVAGGATGGVGAGVGTIRTVP